MKTMKVMNHGGLCNNCTYNDTCIYKKEVKEVILFCEEHLVTEQEPTPIPEHPIEINNHFKHNLKGLCGSCDHWDYCALVSENNIILNCEHYQ